MFRRLFYYIAISLFILVLGSCGRDKNAPKGSPINEKVAELDNTPDSALLVRLNDVRADSIIVTLIPENVKKSFCVTEAHQANMIKGSLTIGDTLSVFPENKTKNVKICIDVSELRGRWFYDMTQHRGMTFDPLGAMSSINSDRICFKEWKLLNGKLYIYYIDMQQVIEGRDQYLVDEADMTSLTKEHLVLNFLGQSYNCKRQHGVIKFRN